MESEVFTKPRSRETRAGLVNAWLRDRLPVLRRSRPPVRVLLHPAAEQNPFLLVTKSHLEGLGAQTKWLRRLDPVRITRLAPFYDILHLTNLPVAPSTPAMLGDWLPEAGEVASRLSALLLARRLGLKIFWTIYNEPSPMAAHEWLEWISRQGMFHLVDRIICPSMATRKVVTEWHASVDEGKLLHIPHHSFGAFYPKQVNRRQALDHLHLQPNGRVFICFGGIHPYKGLTDLIPLFGRSPLNEHTLIVAGSPSNKHYAATIEGLCSRFPNVHPFLRYIPTDEVQYFLQAADLFVMPFKEVLNSGSIMLAMSFGKPVIAPRVGSIPEVVNPGCSVLFDQAGSGQIKEALVRSLDLNLEKAQAEARRVAQSYSPNIMARRLIESYLQFYPNRPGLPEEEPDEIT